MKFNTFSKSFLYHTCNSILCIFGLFLDTHIILYSL